MDRLRASPYGTGAINAALAPGPAAQTAALVAANIEAIGTNLASAKVSVQRGPANYWLTCRSAASAARPTHGRKTSERRSKYRNARAIVD